MDPHYDLVIIGTGSGNSLIGPEMDHWRIAIIEKGAFGGTCLNVGCIPTKMMVYPADVAHHARHGERLGVHTSFDHADWPAIVQRVFGRIDPIAEGGRQYRHSLPNVDVYEGVGRFVAERTLEVNGTRLTGDRVVIAAGARPFVPPIAGLADVPFHTSDTVMRLDRLPQHLVIIGGGFIASEFGHVFEALGSTVTIINRGHRLLQAEDHDVSVRFTELADQRFDLALGATIHEVRHDAASGRTMLTVDCDRTVGSTERHTRTIDCDTLLVAAGRVSNSDTLAVADGGIVTDVFGNVTVDEYGRTSSRNVWALGDINGRHQLKHMANGEAKVVRDNLAHDWDDTASLRRYDSRPAPHAVFSVPQVGAVGLTEAEAAAHEAATGAPYCVAVQEYGGSAYGWAMEDTTGFCKLIGDPLTRRLVGAHVIGYQASMLVQQLVQGMHLGTTVDEMAVGQVWIHPALNEVNEVALLKLMEAFDAHAAAH